MADIETLKTRLAEAEDARHALATGGRVVDVWKDGRRVRYAEANRGDLDTYIDGLKALIEAGEQPVETARPRRRFIPVAFG